MILNFKSSFIVLKFVRSLQFINNDEDDEDDEDDKDDEEEFFFAKMLKMIKYASLPNLVRVAQWEHVSDYYYYDDYDYYR